MLIVFFGPTGAGKSTLMKSLHDNHGFRMIEVVTTRPPRAYDPGRRSVTDAEYNQLERTGYLIWSNTVNGFRYGTPRSEVENAAADPTPSHLLDFSIENVAKIEQLSGYRAAILLLPAWPIIESRLSSGARPDRLALARQQYDMCELYSMKHPESVIDGRVVTSAEFADTLGSVLNFLNELSDTEVLSNDS